MRILITGGNGMVGRNLREQPAAQNHDILSPGRADLDLLNTTAVQDYMNAHKPDVVIHAAGRVGGIQANIAHPVAFLSENTTIGQNVILGAWNAGVRNLLNLGSTCIYPRNGQNPLTEDQILTAPLEPTNEGYALAKIMALRLCEYIRREDPEAQYKTLIPCNLYGRHDTFDPAASHLIPAILQKMDAAQRDGASTVEIWGDGTARREFMYAGDLADMIWRAVDDIEGLPDLVNVGLGHDHSINDYYRICADILGWDGEFTHDLTRPVGMKQKLCDASKVNAWGWTAPTSLTDGLSKTYEFYQKGLTS